MSPPGPETTSSEWVVEFCRQLRRGRSVLLQGNIRDLAIHEGASVPFVDALRRCLQSEGYQTWVEFTPGEAPKIQPEESNTDPARAAIFGPAKGPTAPGTPSAPSAAPVFRLGAPMSQVRPMEAALTLKRKVCAVLSFADLFTSGDGPRADEREFLIALDQLIRLAASRGRAMVFTASSLAQVPRWLHRDNPNLALVVVGRPSLKEREWLFRTTDPGSVPVTDDVCKRLALLTDGFTACDIVALMDSNLDLAADPRTRVEHFVRRRSDDPWEDGSFDPEAARSRLNARVIGQPEAVNAVVDVLTNARGGIDLEQTGRGTRPRGVMFFVGPSGVGKTELAKAVTEMIFGDPGAFSRFDMSEYNESHTSLRLTGAPPSYVGHEAGGQLTNRVRERPFSVLLFDEIDKAHPLVLDKFLQILDEGRLTDGLGETVSFANTLIIFTSNTGQDPASLKSLGLLSGEWERVSPYGTLRGHFASAVTSKFIELNRPELLGRIGTENIVVFDALRRASVGPILDILLSGVAASARAKRQIELQWDSSVLAAAEGACLRATMLGARNLRNFVQAQILPAINEAALRDKGAGVRAVSVQNGRVLVVPRLD